MLHEKPKSDRLLGVTSGGTQEYQTMTVPGGGSAIIVPNGGSTSLMVSVFV